MVVNRVEWILKIHIVHPACLIVRHSLVVNLVLAFIFVSLGKIFIVIFWIVSQDFANKGNDT